MVAGCSGTEGGESSCESGAGLDCGHRMSGDELQAELDVELPSRLPIGRGSFLLVRGRCHHPTENSADLALHP